VVVVHLVYASGVARRVSMVNSRSTLPVYVQHWWLWFAAAFLIAFVSFWPSFFSAIVSAATHILIHGLSATAWMLLAVVQAVLIRSRWRRHHRKLGYVSISLAVVVVVSGLWVLKTMMLGGSQRDGFALSMKFFYLDITGLALFCVFLGLAIKAARLRDFALHLRLIACTAIIPLEAVLERTYLYGFPSLVPNLDAALIASEITLIVFTAVLVTGEWWYRRVRWPFAVMLTYYVVMLFTQDRMAQADWLISLALGYANL